MAGIAEKSLKHNKKESLTAKKNKLISCLFFSLVQLKMFYKLVHENKIVNYRKKII